PTRHRGDNRLPPLRGDLPVLTQFDRPNATHFTSNNNHDPLQTPTDNLTSDDPDIRLSTTSLRQSTTSERATPRQMIRPSSSANHAPTVKPKATGGPFAQYSAAMPTSQLPILPSMVAPLPLSPARQHSRTTRPRALVKDWHDQPWVRMGR
ncbi:hypothetical protein PSTG_19840, partial [Puccinia striiformis f. sp. tritici PST-78]